MKAGQFVEIGLSGFYLKRPFSVAYQKDGATGILYKVAGRGTKAMSELPAGECLDVLTKLGNGFEIENSQKPLLIGGGIGIAPLYFAAKAFYEKGIRPKAVLGFRNRDEAFYIDKFQELCDVTVATDDGSLGFCANTVCALKQLKIDFDRYFACGPAPMLKALWCYAKNGQLSLEARMGCGFGACMGCTIQTIDGPKRICKEGPVFEAAELVFD